MYIIYLQILPASKGSINAAYKSSLAWNCSQLFRFLVQSIKHTCACFEVDQLSVLLVAVFRHGSTVKSHTHFVLYKHFMK